MFWKLADVPAQFQIEASTGGRSMESLSRMTDAKDVGQRSFHHESAAPCGQFQSSRSTTGCAVEVGGCREVCVIADVPSTSRRLVRLGVASRFGVICQSFEVRFVALSARCVCGGQASLEWLGNVRSVTHDGEGDKLESMETLRGLWVPHCGLSKERALCCCCSRV